MTVKGGAAPFWSISRVCVLSSKKKESKLKLTSGSMDLDGFGRVRQARSKSRSCSRSRSRSRSRSGDRRRRRRRRRSRSRSQSRSRSRSRSAERSRKRVKISSGGEKFAPLATSRDADESGRDRRGGDRRAVQGGKHGGQQRDFARPVPLVAATYQQWMTSQPHSIGPTESAAKYEAYAAEFEEKTARSFFRRHQFEAWFRRRYATRELLEHRRDTDRAARATAQELREAMRAGQPLLWPSLDCVRAEGEAAKNTVAADGDARDGRKPTPKPARRTAAGMLNAAHASRIANVLRIRDIPVR